MVEIAVFARRVDDLERVHRSARIDRAFHGGAVADPNRRRGRHLARRSAGLLRRARGRCGRRACGRRLKLGRRRRPMAVAGSRRCEQAEACDEGAVCFQYGRAVVARGRRPSTLAAAASARSSRSTSSCCSRWCCRCAVRWRRAPNRRTHRPQALERRDRRPEGCRGDARRPGRCVKGSRSFLWRGAAGEFCGGAPPDPAEARADGAGARGALQARRREPGDAARFHAASGCACSVRSKATGTTSVS